MTNLAMSGGLSSPRCHPCPPTATTTTTTIIITTTSSNPAIIIQCPNLRFSSNNNLNDNSMVAIMAGPGQNMNMNNVGRAFSPGTCIQADLKRKLYSCKKRLGRSQQWTSTRWPHFIIFRMSNRREGGHFIRKVFRNFDSRNRQSYWGIHYHKLFKQLRPS